MACETLTNQFLDLKNPHLESKIIKIGHETLEIWDFMILDPIRLRVKTLNSFQFSQPNPVAAMQIYSILIFLVCTILSIDLVRCQITDGLNLKVQKALNLQKLSIVHTLYKFLILVLVRP